MSMLSVVLLCIPSLIFAVHTDGGWEKNKVRASPPSPLWRRDIPAVGYYDPMANGGSMLTVRACYHGQIPSHAYGGLASRRYRKPPIGRAYQCHNVRSLRQRNFEGYRNEWRVEKLLAVRSHHTLITADTEAQDMQIIGILVGMSRTTCWQ